MKRIVTINDHDSEGHGTDLYYIFEVSQNKEHNVKVLQIYGYKKRSQTGKLYEEVYFHHERYQNAEAPKVPDRIKQNVIDQAICLLGTMWKNRKLYYKTRNGYFLEI